MYSIRFYSLLVEKVCSVFVGFNLFDILHEYFDFISSITSIALTDDLQLQNSGVNLAPGSSKIAVDDKDRTNVDHIYAVGDVLEGKPELTRMFPSFFSLFSINQLIIVSLN